MSIEKVCKKKDNDKLLHGVSLNMPVVFVIYVQLDIIEILDGSSFTSNFPGLSGA